MGAANNLWGQLFGDGGATAALSFVISSPDYDSVNMVTSGFDATATNVTVNYTTGSYPADSTVGTKRFSFPIADTSVYSDTTILMDVGDDVIQFWRMISYTPGGSANNSDTVLVSDDALPVASDVVLSGSVAQGSTDTTNYTYSDDEGDIEGLTTHQYYRADDAVGTNITIIAGATSATYVTVLADYTKHIIDSVTPVTLGGISGLTVGSNWLGPITNEVPTASSVTSTGTLAQGDVLTRSYSYADTESDAEATSTNRWFRANDVGGTGAGVIGGETGNTYTSVLADYTKYIAPEITPIAATGNTDGTLVVGTYRGPITNEVPTVSSVSVSGTKTVGYELTGTGSYADTESDAEGTSTYDWEVANDGSGTGSAAVTDSTRISIFTDAADEDKYLRFRYTPIAATGNPTGTGIWSSWYGPIVGTAPDTADSFIVSAHDLDTANVNIIGMDDPDSVIVNYATGLTPPATRFAGTIAIQTDDTLDVKDAKVKIDVPDDNTNYAFSGWYKANGSWQTDLQNDSTQLDSIGVEVVAYNDRHFYVNSDSSGATVSDLSSGTYADSAWATLARVTAEVLQADDTVSFIAGSLFREELQIDESGTRGAMIVYIKEGVGDNPLILGSEKIDTWTLAQGDSIWESADVTSDPSSGSSRWGNIYLYKDDSVTMGVHENYTSNFANLEDAYDYTWNASTTYLNSPSDPDALFDSTEYSERDYSIYMANDDEHEWIEVNGIDMRHGRGDGFSSGYPGIGGMEGLVFRNCSIQYVSVRGSGHGYGIEFYHSNSLIENCYFSDNGRRAISMNTYITQAAGEQIAVDSVIIRDNTFERGYHTTSIDFSNNASNTDTIRNIFFYNNIVNDADIDYLESAWNSNQMFFQLGGTSGFIDEIYVVGNVFARATARNLLFEGVTHSYVWNNTLVGHSENIVTQPYSSVSYNSDVAIADYRNNILYQDMPVNGFDRHGIFLYYTDYNNGYFSEKDYNLYYQLNPNSAADRNFSSHSNNTSGVANNYWSTDDWATYLTDNADSAFEANSPVPIDPYFTDLTNRDYTLTDSSSAADSGVVIAYKIIYDVFNVADTINKYDLAGVVFNRTNPPIGAYQAIVRPYVLSAEIGTYSQDSVLVLFNESLNEDSVTVETALNFTEGGTTYGQSGRRISADSLIIGLDSTATHSVTYLLDYVRDYPELQGTDNDTVASFTDQAVINNMPTPPMVSSAEIGTYNDTIISLVMNKALDTDSVPGASSFNFTTSTAVETIQSVTLSGSTVYLHINGPLSGDSTLQLDYTNSAYPKLQSSVNVEAATWSNQAVTNNLPATPILASGEVGTINDSTFVFVFNTDLNEDSIPGLASFTITEGTATLGLDSIRVTSDSIVIIADSICVSDSTYLVDYSATSYPRIQNVSEVTAASWTDSSVTNNVTAGSSYSTEYQALYNAYTTKPHDSINVKLDTMFMMLVDSGLYAKIEYALLPAAHINSDGEAFINIMNPGTNDATNNGASFTAFEGIDFNGSSQYANTNWSTVADGVSVGLDNLCAGSFIMDDVDNGGEDWGAYDGTDHFWLVSRSSGNAYMAINSSTYTTSSNSISTGLIATQRTGSTQAEFSRNGNAWTDAGLSSVGEVAADIYLGCYNNNGTAAEFASREIAFFFVSVSLTDDEISDLHYIINWYMSSNGKGF